MPIHKIHAKIDICSQLEPHLTYLSVRIYDFGIFNNNINAQKDILDSMVYQNVMKIKNHKNSRKIMLKGVEFKFLLNCS